MLLSDEGLLAGTEPFLDVVAQHGVADGVSRQEDELVDVYAPHLLFVAALQLLASFSFKPASMMATIS